MKLQLAMISFLICISLFTNAQFADYIVLKKNGKAVQRFYSGSNIEFQTNTGAYLNANITKMKNDTIYLREFILQKMITKFGFYVIDTLGSFNYKFHYNQIAALGKKPVRGFNLNRSAGTLFSGGLLLTVASLVVFAADKQKFSPALLGASAGLGALGYIMGKGGSKPIRIGKKYKMVYFKMS
jgi:hypothetical protein